MKINFSRLSLYLALFVLYLLHNDLWFWNDATLIFGLPVGLLYHFGFCIATALMLFFLVKFAWPRHLEVDSDKENIA